MVIHQGDVFWVELGLPSGSEAGFRRPHVVIQNNAFNHSRIHTVVICAVSTNLRLGEAPGNVLLAKGEASLPKPSVVNISQLFTVDKQFLYEKIGSLSPRSLSKVLAGIHRLLEPREFGEQAFP